MKRRREPIKKGIVAQWMSQNMNIKYTLYLCDNKTKFLWQTN